MKKPLKWEPAGTDDFTDGVKSLIVRLTVQGLFVFVTYHVDTVFGLCK